MLAVCAQEPLDGPLAPFWGLKSCSFHINLLQKNGAISISLR